MLSKRGRRVGMMKGTAMVGGIPCGLREDAHEGVDPSKKIDGDLHQDRE
jgi:hypothetical protein